MSAHLIREIERLKKHILTVCAMVEERVRMSARAVARMDLTLAEEVVAADTELDLMEIEVEEECLKTLALNQPVAHDLRFIAAVLKINNDLERLGDNAVNIAKLVRRQTRNGPQPLLFDFAGAFERVLEMLGKAIEALINRDAALARQVCAEDEEIDLFYKDIRRQVEARIVQRPDLGPLLIAHLQTARHLERMGDLTTNIAEDVIYMIEGEIVRHAKARATQPPAGGG